MVQQHNQHARGTLLAKEDKVLAPTSLGLPKWLPGTLVAKTDPVELHDGSIAAKYLSIS